MSIEQLPADDAARDHAPPPAIVPPPAAEPTLGTVVTALVRGTPDTVLAICVIVGLVGSGVLVLAVSIWSRAIPPLILLSAFGAWGMVDRVGHSTGPGRIGVALARAAIILVSIAAVGAMILSFLGVAIGTWIS